MLLLQFPELCVDADAYRPADEAASILVEGIASSLNSHMDIIQVDEVR